MEGSMAIAERIRLGLDAERSPQPAVKELVTRRLRSGIGL
jgi:hypothetical protein